MAHAEASPTPLISGAATPGRTRFSRRLLPFNRLAFKIALIVTATTPVLAALTRAVWPTMSGWGLFAYALAVGAVAYVVAYRLLAQRIELARTTLMQIRRHQFENLEAAHIPPGDELNALVWQVYRTGLTLEKEIRELRKLENYRREFLGHVSHELKTPIFSIRGFSETLLDGALDDERVNRTFVEKILRNTDRLGHLTQDLSEIARIEMGELAMKIEPFSLKRLIHEAVEALEQVARAKDVAVHRRVPEGLPLVLGDRERIRQVLVNLIDNAIKYNNAGGTVEVVARRLPTNEVKVSVVDDGIGVAPQDIPRLTERFYRVDKSRSRDQGGTGLGLAIVKHILGAHGRTLLIESDLNRGSTFGFSLAIAKEPGL